MKTYRVKVHELVWQDSEYTIEAENEEQIPEMINSGDYTLEWTDFDCIDDFDIKSIEEIKE